MPYLIDTHVHLDHPQLAPKLGQVLTHALNQGVSKMVNIGHDLQSSRESVRLAAEYSNIAAAVGIHPHAAKYLDDSCLAEIERLAAAPGIVAIGEIGLDYHYDFSPRDVQRRAFRMQIALARKLNLPVVIHQREAANDTLEILQEFAPYPQGGIMHCFSETMNTALQCIELNLWLGFGGTVTFKNARQVKAVAAEVPLERLVLETDSPYLAPRPHRGKTNQPGYVLHVAKEIAALRGIPLAQVTQTTTATAEFLFRWHE